MLSKRILVLMFVVAFLLVGCLPDIAPSVTPPVIENQAPVITSVHIPTSATVGVAYTYDVEATDPDGDTLTYSLAVKPIGMTINSATGVIRWVPYSTQIGERSVTVEVSDGTLSDTQSFKIVVSGAEEEEEEFPGGGGYVPTPTPVELTKIVVEPNTMDLFVGQIVAPELFDDYSITAYYSDESSDVIDFDDCEFDLTVEVADIIAYDDDTGVVTAIGTGTFNIIITYQGEEDKILVTVTYLPMEIIADMPIFEVFETARFTVEIVANSDVGKNVLVYFTMPGISGDYYVHYYNDVAEDWVTLTAGKTFIFGDPSSGFTLEDEVMLLDGRFKTIGTFITTVEVWEVTEEGVKIDPLCSEVITAVVEPPQW